MIQDLKAGYNGADMPVLKILFMLLLIVPIAVFMIYILVRMIDDMNLSIKNSRSGKQGSASAGTRRSSEYSRHDAGTHEHKKPHVGSPDKNAHIKESDHRRRSKNDERTESKRKRRKIRKKRKKERRDKEQQI